MKTLPLSQIQEAQRKFAADRDWQQFHTPKNLAMALIGEAAELTEIFQWLTPDQSVKIKNNLETKQKVEDELADIFYYLARLSDILEIDLEKAIWTKMEKNAQKYPVTQAKGNAQKYTEWQKE